MFMSASVSWVDPSVASAAAPGQGGSRRLGVGLAPPL